MVGCGGAEAYSRLAFVSLVDWLVEWRSGELSHSRPALSSKMRRCVGPSDGTHIFVSESVCGVVKASIVAETALE